MADAKISALPALAGTDLAAGDLVPVVDVSATTAGSKQMTIDEFLTGILGETSVLDTTYSLASAATFGWSTDVLLARDSANTLALRNNTNAQIFRIYNTYNGADGEWGYAQWSENVFQLGATKSGSGANRAIALQTAGSSRLSIDANGVVTVNNDSTSFQIQNNGNNRVIIYDDGSTFQGVFLHPAIAIKWDGAGPSVTNNDLGIKRNAAGVLEINNGTAGTYRDLLARNVRTQATTVSGLVAASTAGAGARAFVTDASATTFLTVVTDGGSNAVPVVSDGTNWLIG